MPVDRAALEAESCWFGVDRVSDTTMTDFKREARYRQALWRRDRGLAMGSHKNSSAAVRAGGPVTIANGSRLDPVDADLGQNFLSEPIWNSVRDRLANPQPNQTLNPARLRGDLLSSMPMCFNLFGELSDDPGRSSRAAELLLPSVGGGEVDVRFEWSPERSSTHYTNDRTAFDVALLVDPGPKSVIGVETKYHEHALPEKKPGAAQLERHEAQRAMYTRLAEQSGVFRSGWQDSIYDTDLEQIWRDHLLLLSMLNHPDQWDRGRYVIVFPSRNVSFADASARYHELLVDDETFAALTLEELLGAQVLHTAETRAAFRKRYLW
ncbi:hypothetical protein D9V37_16385 [Nocardioides mangrovicus]|uniref:PD-(D/E)XK nuclease-like domain-containing protein n=1 Tax=Nocardioides mangrovicus TaxID=2478913 RepID=A0A3L8NYE5_9ACTN|nr:hypothetical protein [Nocardioides mangrovicus]RLV47722.1 hypothetical protein D9V37_16385 [Nocardioides mangrovicus]